METAYRFPIVRLYTLFSILLLADLISSLILWIIPASRDIEYDLTNFQLKVSVFDLTCISLIRCIIMLVLLASLENNTISAAQEGKNDKSVALLLKLFCGLVFLGTLAYVVCKDVFVLLEYQKNRHIMKYSTHYALCISAATFAVLELVLYFKYLHHLKYLQTHYAVLQEPGNSEQKPKAKKVNVKRLLTLAKPESFRLFIGTLGLCGSTGSQMIAPLYFGYVIQAAATGTMDVLNNEILSLFIIYMVGAVAAFFRSWLYTLAGQSIVARLRSTLFLHIIQQEISFFDLNRTGELMNRLSSDSQVIQNALSVNISMLFRYSLQIIGSVVIMFITSPRLAGVLLAVIPFVAIGAQRYGAYVRNQQKKFQDDLAKAATNAEETISSIRTVRSFSQEKSAADEYNVEINKSFMAGKKLALASGFFNMAIGILTQGTIVLVLWYGGKLVHDGDMNVGKLTSFILYALNVALAFAFLSSLYGDFMKAVGASIRIFELYDRVPEIESGNVKLPHLKEDVIFNDISFNYPSRPDNTVLKGFTFNMKPGDTIALVGPSGGGKSTVMSLLERFYDPNEGSISVAGHPLISLDLQQFRKKMSIVSQEPVLFATTIAKNIAYGRDATQKEIEDAAKQANAHEFILNFEEGYETNVGERGVKLSGGQKQRVAIARALLMDPDILLLDEATSALDAESEHLVQEAIDRAMIGRTVLVIAHRLSTVRDASRVIVINKGTIAEEGTHEELLVANGVYKKLVMRQLEKGDRNNGDEEEENGESA